MDRSDPEWEEYRACKRKTRFETRPSHYAGWLRDYRCRFCGGWHLTSRPRSGRQKLQLVPQVSEQSQ